jgi:hypothetical protein
VARRLVLVKSRLDSARARSHGSNAFTGNSISGTADRVADRIRQLVYLDALIQENGRRGVYLHPWARHNGAAQMSTDFPKLFQVVLDATDARRLAEFYRELLGWQYAPGHEPPPPGQPDPLGEEWLVLREPSGTQRIAFQHVPALPKATWPEGPIPQQLHFDLMAGSKEQLAAHHQRALALGATVLQDNSDDPQEPLRVYADPAGHPFCLFTWILPPGRTLDEF